MLQTPSAVPGWRPAGDESSRSSNVNAMVVFDSYLGKSLHVGNSSRSKGLLHRIHELVQSTCNALQVDNAAICAAIKDVFNETRTILEPAGAVAVAGVKAYLKARPHIQVTLQLSVPAVPAVMHPERRTLLTSTYTCRHDIGTSPLISM